MLNLLSANCMGTIMILMMTGMSFWNLMLKTNSA